MSHIFISAAHKSSGKTTISIGLTAAIRSMGHSIQTYKKGPDYIDPMWLGRAAACPCYNLDFYTMRHTEIRDKFNLHMQTADVGLIEGNKGLYDGLDLDGSNSNAALASFLGAPVVLVIDSRGMTRGIAPLVLGYQQFDPDINIQGVIFNQVGGSRHEGKLRAILEHYTDVTVLGAVHKDSELNIDERHLGLIPSNEEHQADKKINYIENRIKEQVNLDQLLSIANTAIKPEATPDLTLGNTEEKNDIKIGIFKDESFGFYYPDDLEAMQHHGAELVYIDSLNDSSLPPIDGLFIGGGFPETQMQALEENQGLRESVRKTIESGLPTYAECGGLMYLSRSIQWKGKTFDMVGVVQGDIHMHKKPQGRGYIKLETTKEHPWGSNENQKTIFAHEFHYSELCNIDHDYPYAYKVLRGMGIDGKHDGLIYKNLLANYGHLRNTQDNEWVKYFIKFIKSNKISRESMTLSSQTH